MCAEHVRFCRERPQKLPICAELGITHFIDDHMEIMDVLRPIVPHLYLFGQDILRSGFYLASKIVATVADGAHFTDVTAAFAPIQVPAVVLRLRVLLQVEPRPQKLP